MQIKQIKKLKEDAERMKDEAIQDAKEIARLEEENGWLQAYMKMTDSTAVEILKRRIKELQEELDKKEAQIEELKSKIDRLQEH